MVRIFLSAVSDEFRDYREQLRHDLTLPNVEVKIQEDLKDQGTGTLDMLDVYIATCDVVVHLVGAMTGAAARPASTGALLEKYRDLPDRLPPLRQPLADGLAIPYTQWEAWLALYHKKLLVIAQADDSAPRGPTWVPTDDSRAAQQKHLARLADFDRYPGKPPFTGLDHLAKQILFTGILKLLAREDARQLVAAGEMQAGPDREQAVGAAVESIARSAAAGDMHLQQALDLLKARKVDEASKLLRTIADEKDAAIAQAQARVREDSKQAAIAWRNLGAIAGLRDPKSAREAYARAVQLDPEDGESLYWDGWFQLDADALVAAERSYKQLLALDRTVPDSSAAYWARLGLGDIERAHGRLDSALAIYRAAQASAAGRVTAELDKAAWQRNLTVAYIKIGDVLKAQSNLPEALKLYGDALSIRADLAKSDCSNAGRQRDLSLSYDRIGDVLTAQDRLPEALNAYRDAFAIAVRLAKSDRSNAAWQYDLSVSYEKIGNALTAQGKLPEALESYRDALAVRVPLAKADKDNAGRQSDLALLYDSTGDVLLAQSKLPEALEAYRDALAIRDGLAKDDSGNTGRKHDLSIAYSKVARAFRSAGDKAKALDAFRQGKATLAPITILSPGNATWERDLAWFDGQIVEMER